LNSPDIKPKRSETLANTKRRNIGGSSLLFLSFIGLVNIIGLLILGLWFFNSSGYQQEAGQNFVERISLLEEKTSTDQGLKNELILSLEDDIKFINKEIRKLWDLSNKKNRNNITNLSGQVNELENYIDDVNKLASTIAAKQRAMDLELAKLERARENFQEKLNLIGSLSDGSDMKKRMSSQEEAIKAFDAHRKQINRTILDLQSRLNELQIRVEDSL
tara:strand:+ start:1181 stop:1834 length:654 start_codon:yes stop_codon:yes gene_type:complete